MINKINHRTGFSKLKIWSLLLISLIISLISLRLFLKLYASVFLIK